MARHRSTILRDNASRVAALALLVALPLAGLVLTWRPWRAYLEFPPRTRYVIHASFAWPVLALFAGFTVAVVLLFVLRVGRSQRALAVPPRPARPFPWWGWAGLAVGASAWVAAWTRCAGLRSVQEWTFLPLWLAYIVVVNALTFRRTGRCLLTDCPRFCLLLFPVSAVFWWYFEYLNRFVQNWVYLGAAQFGPVRYAAQATLSFATVLPAVLATRDFLATFPRLTAGLDGWVPLRLGPPQRLAWLALTLAGLVLVNLGLYPNQLFGLLWTAPLVVLVAAQTLAGRRTVVSGLAQGRWAPVVRLALAALICGGFWEMWNWLSTPKWIYDVPYVGRFHVFEMPLLGYAGYLPFGLECQAVVDLFCPPPPDPA